MLSLISIKKSALPWIISWISLAAAHAAVTPYAHYRMGDSAPTSNGGNNLPYDSSGNGWHMTNAASGTPVITPTGGPSNDAYYTFNGSDHYFYGTADGWNPPEDKVGVEVWVRTSNLSQVNKHVFGTGDNTLGLNHRLLAWMNPCLPHPSAMAPVSPAPPHPLPQSMALLTKSKAALTSNRSMLRWKNSPPPNPPACRQWMRVGPITVSATAHRDSNQASSTSNESAVKLKRLRYQKQKYFGTNLAMKQLPSVLLLSVSAIAAATPPVTPATERTPALAGWEAMKYGAFIHFGMSTFTQDQFGKKPATLEDYNPTALDVDQWVRVIRDAGMKYALLTAKHCYGHCLWGPCPE